MATDNYPNIIFVGAALEFYETQGGPAQSRLAAIAASLSLDPIIDGDTKHMVPIRKEGPVTLYGRAYIGEGFWVLYEYDDQASPPILRVLDVNSVDIAPLV